LCKVLNNLLMIDFAIDDKPKIESRLESVGRVFTELMEVLEKKTIVTLNLLDRYFLG
jgi:hypothetical protein